MGVDRVRARTRRHRRRRGRATLHARGRPRPAPVRRTDHRHRLLPYDDAYTKLDRELLVPDPPLRARVLPLVGQSTLGYTPGAILLDGEIVGAWQRQQRKVRIHPWSMLSPAVRDAIEAEALGFPIAGSAKPSVAWD